MDYTDIHWGTNPTEELDLSCPVGKAAVVGELKAASYCTIKADKPDVYEHEFKKFYCEAEKRKRGPYLLKSSKTGEFELPGCENATMAMGNAIDFELVDGSRLVCQAGCFLATNSSGDKLWLVGPNVPYDIEKRKEGPIVTPRGIEA
jgi:hypothetical protein